MHRDGGTSVMKDPRCSCDEGESLRIGDVTREGRIDARRL